MPNVSGVIARHVNAAAGGSAAQSLILFAEIGPSGTGTADVLKRLTSEAVARDWFGTSQGSEASARFFSLTRLTKTLDLYAFGQDSSGWMANTWTVTWTDTTTAAGARVLRIASHTMNVQLNNGDDPTAQAVAMVLAITTAAIPFSAVNTAGVVTVTSLHLGEATNFIALSIDQLDTENGVPGSTVAIVNDLAGSGEETALSTTQNTELRTLDGSVFWASNGRNATFLTDMENEAQAGWDTRNNYAQILQGVSTVDQAAFVTFAANQNKRRFDYMASGDIQEYELAQSVQLAATIVQAVVDKERKNPGLVNVRILTMPAPGPEFKFDRQIILDAGGVHVANVNGAAIALKVVTNRLLNDTAQPDLTEQSMSGVLARREMLERELDVIRPHLGEILVSPGTSSPSSVTLREVGDELSTLMVELRNEGIIFTQTEDEARELILTVTAVTDGNIENGILVTHAAPIAKVTNTLETVAFTT